ncbi:hypothetical protein B0E38_02586 [Streptomyces sp. 111WW2]|uniref:hypothetical protein n=1 Tax=Streptomyces sp. 111WW2 TaxID=1945515 RepID=UPI000D0C9093|nr:hypothetical protein [Streptomyces sp. 111WW2]PSK57055.1 hypothetical protein B0E38_02586 [Streptomyces sp. 111WW2]
MNDRENTLQHINGLFYMDLGLCGCGSPDDAFDLIRDLLKLAPFYDHRTEVVALIGDGAASHIILSTLDTADLIEHGGSIHGSWLTDKGQWYLNALTSVDDWEQIRDVGLPHDGRKCTDTCWLLPAVANQ